MADISLIDYGSAEAQAQIGLLLQARSPLNTLSNNANVSIAQQAVSLLSMQTYLEGQVATFATLSDRMKLGTASTQDYISWTAILAAITLHNNKVGALAKKAGVSFNSPSFLSQYGLYIAGGIGLILLLLLINRK